MILVRSLMLKIFSCALRNKYGYDLISCMKLQFRHLFVLDLSKLKLNSQMVDHRFNLPYENDFPVTSLVWKCLTRRNFSNYAYFFNFTD